MVLIALEMDVLVFQKVSNDLTWLKKFVKSIVRKILHFGIPVSLARKLRAGS